MKTETVREGQRIANSLLDEARTIENKERLRERMKAINVAAVHILSTTLANLVLMKNISSDELNFNISDLAKSVRTNVDDYVAEGRKLKVDAFTTFNLHEEN